jgi:hypothetical protein
MSLGQPRSSEVQSRPLGHINYQAFKLPVNGPHPQPFGAAYKALEYETVPLNFVKDF